MLGIKLLATGCANRSTTLKCMKCTDGLLTKNYISIVSEKHEAALVEVNRRTVGRFFNH